MLSLVIIVAFAVMALSTAYHVLAFTPLEFAEKREVREYENAVKEVSVMDDWTRTKYYWSNNLRVAEIYAIGAPTFFGFNSVVASSYSVGMSLAYRHHLYGAGGIPASLAQFFTHGLLELSGFYLIAAVSLRVGWNLWKGLGHLATVGRGEKRWSWGLSEQDRREILKHKVKIKLLLGDFIVFFAVGTFLVFLAAPIEAYVSPSLGVIFLRDPLLAAAFFAAVGFLYLSVVARGFNAMRSDLKLTWENARLAFKGKWRPAQLPLLIFTIFFVAMLLRIMF